MQKDKKDEQGCVSLVMLSHECLESNMQIALDALHKLNSVHADIVRIRVESLD